MYQDAYLETEVLSASPVQLVSMLYRGALDSLRSAVLALERGDISERSRRLSHAEAILGELTVSLDRTQGGDLSRDLSELYDYMQRRIAQGNFEQTKAPIEEVCVLLSTLLEAWTEIAAASSVAVAASSAYSTGGASLAAGGSVAGRRTAATGSIWAVDDTTADESLGQFSGVDFERSRLDRVG
jgi:flagellar protein FliS